MRRVYKYSLGGMPGEFQCIDVPVGASLLCFQMQHGMPTAWFEVDPINITEKRRYKLLGTGWDIPRDHCYVGTVQSGEYVWHLYQVP